ncbi:hypothetical protein BDQ17DRAFT_71286 [Cyathus striatus]|nr:hypothetical protein BDQ17DRAFT_71286 [Cyathus striatus]
MSDNELKLLAISALGILFSSQQISTPITSTDLLARVITTKTPSGLFSSSSSPRFRLTDLPKFESILEDLSHTWEDGRISLTGGPGSGEMTIWEVSLSAVGHPIGSVDLLNSRKRKRVVDEDADSAAGDDDDTT